jgi:hypothetical protein
MIARISAATSGQTQNWVRKNPRVNSRTLAALDVRECEGLGWFI